MEAEPRIVRQEACSPRGVTMLYVLRAAWASPGGTETMIESHYKHTSLAALRELENVDRKQMTSICAKNHVSYKRAMAHFMPGVREQQLQLARRQQKQRRERLRRQLQADLAAVAAAVGL